MIKATRQELLSLVNSIISDEQLLCDRNNDIWSFTEKTAKSIVEKIFAGDLRHSRQPTLTHIFTVAGMDTRGDITDYIEEQERIIRLFHDLFEDTDLEISDGESWGMKIDTLEKINILTRNDDIAYLDYIVRISYVPQCVNIKLDDIEDNLDYSENVNLITPDKLEKINRKIIANNYLNAVKNGDIQAGYNILKFMTNYCTGNSMDTAIEIIDKYSTLHLKQDDHTSLIDPKPHA